MGSGPRSCELLGEILALQVLHDDERRPVGRADIVDPRDVLVPDARDRPRLAQEALRALVVGADGRLQELERDELARA